MPSGRTNNYPESGRGLGHVTLTIFGSTVGYPSDSLASCSVIVCIGLNVWILASALTSRLNVYVWAKYARIRTSGPYVRIVCTLSTVSVFS